MVGSSTERNCTINGILVELRTKHYKINPNDITRFSDILWILRKSIFVKNFFKYWNNIYLIFILSRLPEKALCRILCVSQGSSIAVFLRIHTAPYNDSFPLIKFPLVRQKNKIHTRVCKRKCKTPIYVQICILCRYT